jgi:hypothetical protein
VAGLSWRWIVLMLTAPPAIGVLVAYPFWRRREMIFGNLVGTTVILGAAFALILRESIEIEQVTRQCLQAGYTCWPTPGGFARYAIYAGIGMIEVFALFAWSLNVESRIRNRAYAPEWR